MFTWDIILEINDIVFKLLEILDEYPVSPENYHYRSSAEINMKTLLRLEQDRNRYYYTARAERLLLQKPFHRLYKYYLNWQSEQAYRIINTTLASCSEDLTIVREALLKLKKDVENTPYIRSLIKRIDKGESGKDLVFSGHGAWYEADGKMELPDSDTEIVVYSGLGAGLSDTLAVDIENNQLDPADVTVIHKKDPDKTMPLVKNYPMFFKKPDKVPNFCLIKGSKKPHPRVFERETNKVVFDCSSTDKNYFLLSDVVEMFPGKTFHWAACTGYNGEMDPPFFSEYFWESKSHLESVANKKRKLENTGVECSENNATPHTDCKIT
ncbi:hypothetical protein Lspi_1723 [Legionella spiritensis]|uniref:Uncharacterized protein n=1 Tax=Legionella spiritensis TaxID=452 RepID=A0A0W0Z0W1_LEGSP|nr:hypothetical protein Lspi_1723 [Legionella spiritensis]SNV30889.1 Uncharacterised protein [Legionella spiritensis]